MTSASTADVFGTAALRRRVLDAWAASPARFREDANAEEDLALGGHRGRLVVELAQNAADAAAAAGVPGRLLLALRDGRLVAANTGVPVDAAGVEALSTLRASAKRADDGTVGRFGVGFAAVVTVSDEPSIGSRASGWVRWSRGETAQMVNGVSSLAQEVRTRHGQVPVLRLPFAAVPAEVPDGYDTAVVLPLRDEGAERVVVELLAAVDAALLLALPALAEVVIDVGTSRRVLSATWRGDAVDVTTGGATTTWRIARAAGHHDAAALADRPTEERARRGWSLTWALPVDAAGYPIPLPPTVAAVVHAPTVTDEPLGLPALLIATLPLDPARRRVVEGAAHDAVVAAAGRTYAALVAALPSGPRLLDLVPEPLAATALDAALRRAAAVALADEAWLPAAADPARRLRPRDAVVLDGADDAATAALAPRLDGLLPAAWGRRRGTLEPLGVGRLSIADAVDALSGGRRSPGQWRELYAALAGLPRDELGALPVPLADGRVVRGPRGLVLPGPGLPPGLDVLGLRVVHAEAAHPLLERLGAVPATPRGLLDDAAVRAAVADAAAADEPDPAVTDAVLALVAAAATTAVEHPWRADLLLADDSGGVSPARTLVIPGGAAEQLLDPDEVARPAPDLISRWGSDVLAAVGVLDGLRRIHATDVSLDDDGLDELDDIEGWVDEVTGDSALPPVATELVAVADLDLVTDDGWVQALRHLSTERDLRAAVVEPVRLVDADGHRREAVSYAAWWLRHHASIGGCAPHELRDPGGDALLAGLWPDAPELGLDAALLRAIGVRTTLADVLAGDGGPDALLDRLADPAVPIDRARLRALYPALASVDPGRVSPPARVRVPRGRATVVVDAETVLLVDAPDLLPYARAGSLPVPPAYAGALAEVLDLPLASAVVDARVRSAGAERPVTPVVRALLPRAPTTWMEHDVVLAGDAELDWRVENGVVHAATLDGLARGLAWAAGAWGMRGDVAAVLAAGDADERLAEALLAEADLG